MRMTSMARSLFQCIDCVSHRLQRVDIEPAVGLIHHRKRRIEQRHLKHLVPFLLAAGEAADFLRAARSLLMPTS